MRKQRTKQIRKMTYRKSRTSNKVMQMIKKKQQLSS